MSTPPMLVCGLCGWESSTAYGPEMHCSLVGCAGTMAEKSAEQEKRRGKRRRRRKPVAASGGRDPLHIAGKAGRLEVVERGRGVSVAVSRGELELRFDLEDGAGFVRAMRGWLGDD